MTSGPVANFSGVLQESVGSQEGSVAGEKSRKFYRFRLRFKIAQPGMLKFESSPAKRITFERAGRQITFQSVYVDDISIADSFEFSMGGFRSPDEARAEANAIRRSLLTVGAAIGDGLGVSVGGGDALEKPSNKTRFDCNDKIADKPVDMVNSKSDILIIQQTDPDADYINLEGILGGVWRAITPSAFVEACRRAETHSRNFTSRQMMVLELYNAAYFESSIHAKFLTWMLTVESILEARPRPPRIVDIVRKFNEVLADASQQMHKNKDVTALEAKSLEGLKTTLKYALNESISQGMSRLAREIAGDQKFVGLSAEQFMKKCYTVRSLLVHNGHVGKYRDEYGQLVREFENLARLIVMNFLEIKEFSIPATASTDANFQVGIRFV
jgi:hypothetical protein